MRRALSLRTILIASTAAASAAVALASSVGSAVPSSSANATHSVTVKGTFHHLDVDGSGRTPDFESDVVATSAHVFHVKLAKGQHASSGAKVTLTGNLSDGTLANATL